MALILIADDDPMMGELLRFKLEEGGYDVLIATDGESALRLAREAAPDAIVLDSMMPVLTGPEVLRALKADPRTRSIRVLVLTARKGQDDIVQALRGGAGDYLTKPFLPDELTARIAALLSRKERRRARPSVA